jgi:hypothetical protein
MAPRDNAREPGSRAGTKPVEKDHPRKKLRQRSGRSRPFPRKDLSPIETQEVEVVKHHELEPSEDFARRGDIETERPDHEGPFPDRGRSDEESGRPVQLGGKRHQNGKRHQKPKPEAGVGVDAGDPPEVARSRSSHDEGVQHAS